MTIDSAKQLMLTGLTNMFNFGSLTTNYALWSQLRKFGYAVSIVFPPRVMGTPENLASKRMIRQQLGSDYADAIIPQFYNTTEMRELLCDHYSVFITGSDQVLRPSNYLQATLGWTADSASRLCYASSFGEPEPHKTNLYEFDAVVSALVRYGRVSVRETSAARLLNANGIKTAHTIEPVLLHDADFWEGCAQKHDDAGHIFAYVLDPNPEIDFLLGYASGKLGADIERFGEMWLGGTVGERLGSIMNAGFVITDSFHGMCFAIIYRKPFIAIVNKPRGAERFYDLAEKLRLKSRLIENADEALARSKLFATFDWSECEALLERFRSESVGWLKEALDWAFTNLPEIPKQKRIVDKSLIWYGAGEGAKRLMLFLDRLSLPYPFEIWDRAAQSGRELGGIPVTLPDFGSLRERSDVRVVITIEDETVNEEIVRELRSNGFDSIEMFDEIDRRFRRMLKEAI